MNDKECLSIYNELIHYLHELELDWVVKQVEQSLEEGKIREIDESRTVEEGRIREVEYYRSQNQETIEEYTPKEQLILLIDSIQRAIIDTFDIKNEVYDFLGRESEKTKANIQRNIAFIPFDRKETEPIYLFEEEFIVNREKVQQLKNDLEELRSEVLHRAY